MKFLLCLYCNGELDVLNPHDGNYVKKVKCKNCEFISNEKYDKKDKQPEVTIIKRRQNS